MTRAIPTSFAVLVFAVAAVADAGKAGAPWKWEYRVASKDELAALGSKNVAAGLNKLGEEGWELVAIEPGFAAPPGAVGSAPPQYYFKRPKDLPVAQREAAARRVAAAEAEVELWKDRAAYSARMYRRGLLAENLAKIDQARLRQAELSLEAAKRELEALPSEKAPPPKEPPDKETPGK